MKKGQTSTFLIELPLRVDAGQAHRLRARLEAVRCFYNAMLGEALTRLKQIRCNPRWQAARAIPHTQKQERIPAFARLRCEYRFSEYDLHAYPKKPVAPGSLTISTPRWPKRSRRAYQAYKVIPHHERE